jgi:hypothetical protein
MSTATSPLGRAARLIAIGTVLALLAAMGLSKAGLLPGLAEALARGFGYGYTAPCSADRTPNATTVDGNPLTVCAYSFGQTVGRYSTAPDTSFGPAHPQFNFPDHPGNPHVVPTAQLDPVTVGNTHTQLTQYGVDVNDERIANVDQTITYVNGDQGLRIDYKVSNATNSALKLRTFAGAQFDTGPAGTVTAQLVNAPPRRLEVANVAEDDAASLTETGTPWSNFQMGTERSILAYASQHGELSGQIEPTNPPDPRNMPAVAVEWDDHFASGIPVAGSATYSTVWSIKQSHELKVLGYARRAVGGSRTTVDLSYFDTRGAGAGNRPIRWAVTGANPTSGTVHTDNAGKATAAWTGAHAGLDRFDAFVDLNQNGTQDVGERTGSALRFFIGGGGPTGNGGPSGSGSPPPGGFNPPGGGPPSGGGAPTPPRTRLAGGLPKLRKLAAKGLAITLTMPGPGSVRWQLLLDRRDAKKAGIAKVKFVSLAQAKRTATKAGQKLKATLKLKGKAARKLKKLKKARMTLRTTVTLAGGHPSVANKKLVVKR